jgi:hypothetical protein
MDDSSFHSMKENYNTSKWSPLKEMLIEKPWYYLPWQCYNWAASDNYNGGFDSNSGTKICGLKETPSVHTGVWEYSKMLEV